MNIEIANRLVQLRKQHGLSQEELAARLGLSRQAVSKWERAEASPDTDNLILLSRVYGVSIDELLRTEDEIPEPRPEKGVKITVNGKPVRFNTKDGFHFTIGDEDDADAPLHGGTSGHVEVELDGGAGDGDEGEPGAKKELAVTVPYPILAAIAYFCMGFIWGLWHPGWIVFLTIPLYYPIARWLSGSREHSFWHSFPYTIFVTIVFLLIGCIWGLWHPGWIVFLTIPLYSHIAHAADRRYRARRKQAQQHDL